MRAPPRKLLKAQGVIASMSRKGCCYYNAGMQAFFAGSNSRIFGVRKTDYWRSKPANYLALGPFHRIAKLDHLFYLRRDFDFPGQFACILVHGCWLVRESTLVYGNVRVFGHGNLIINQYANRPRPEILKRDLVFPLFYFFSIQQAGFRPLANDLFSLRFDGIIASDVEIKLGRRRHEAHRDAAREFSIAKKIQRPG